MTEHVQSFDSIEDAFAAMAQGEEAANARIHPRQAAVRDATDAPAYWIRPYAGLLIFGHTPPLRELVALEQGYIERDMTAENSTDLPDLGYLASMQAEHDAVPRVKAELRARGYLTGTCYSTVTPDGEWGDTHCSTLWPITETQFAAARQVGWDLAEPTLIEALRPAFAEIADALHEGLVL